jgi:hypothetical protein
MAEPFIDPAAAEEILETCLEALNAEPMACAFTDWEQEFLESLEVQLEEQSITEEQWQKLKQIYRERVLRSGAS